MVPKKFLTAPVVYMSWWFFILQRPMTTSAFPTAEAMGSLVPVPSIVTRSGSAVKSAQEAPSSVQISQIPHFCGLKSFPCIPGESPTHTSAAPFALQCLIASLTISGFVVIESETPESESTLGFRSTFLPFTSGKPAFVQTCSKAFIRFSGLYDGHFAIETFDSEIILSS